MNTKIKLKCVADYILITPDKPKAGGFEVSGYIDETGIIEDVGPQVSDEMKKLKGKHIVFHAWKCEEKTVQGQKFFLVPESANAVCATI